MSEVERVRLRLYRLYGGTIFVSFVLLTTITLWHFFDLAIWQPIVAIILSCPLSYLATR